MNKILQLSREYRKLNHVELLPHTNNEILEKLFFCMMKMGGAKSIPIRNINVSF